MYFIDAIKAYLPADEEEQAEKEAIAALLQEKGCTVLSRENALAHMTSTAMIFNEEKDKLLMVHHNIYDTWACVGGHADGMDDLLQVALKETEEETGVKNLRSVSEQILSLDILQVTKHYKRGKYVPNHLHLNATYGLIASESEPLRVKADENSAVMWVPIAELDAYSKEPEFVKVYRKIIKKVIK